MKHSFTRIVGNYEEISVWKGGKVKEFKWDTFNISHIAISVWNSSYVDHQVFPYFTSS